MRINFTFKNFEPSEHLKGYAEKRFGKLSKYINERDENPDLDINMRVEKHRHLVEVVFTGNALHLKADEEGPDMYSALDMVLDKLETQIKKKREKSKDRSKRREADAEAKFVMTEVFNFTGEGEDRERTIVETDRYEPKPMDVDEAAMQLESKGLEFLVFINSKTDRVNVVYARRNGDFGLIDPGV